MVKAVGLILFILLFIGCNKPDAPSCLMTKGKSSSEVIAYNSITHFEIYDHFNIQLIQDSLNYIELIGGANEIQNISIEVNEDMLSVKNENKCNFLRSLKTKPQLNIHFEDIAYLGTYGYSNVNCLDTLKLSSFKLECFKTNATHDITINADSLFLLYHLAGNTLQLAGESHYGYFYNAGNGWMHASDCILFNAGVHQESSGDVEINVTNKLNATINGDGNIKYLNSPIINTNYQSGLGKVTPLNN